MSLIPEHLIVFDGICVLCNRFTNYVLKNDSAKVFYFTSYQNLQVNTTDFQLVLPKDLDKSITYYRKNSCYQGSTAILMIYKDLFPWFHWSRLGWLVPRFFRDYLYFKVAAKRYQWFGRMDYCPIPDQEISNRFL
jgi:predicted DCC family thiol-disulfide oxidoreductase YuxK